MTVWLVRILTVAWAGFWLWFGVAWAVYEHLPWQGVALSLFRPGLIFVAVGVISWLWPRPGGVLLVLTGFVLSGWYGIYFGQMPNNTKLFVLATIALPPLAGGLIQLWHSTSAVGRASGPGTAR